jgi:hypothetical protein
MASSFLRFLDHTYRCTTVGRTPLDEWSARRKDLYLTTHNTHNRQTSIPPVGFKPKISVGERPQTYALDRAATGTGLTDTTIFNYFTLTAAMVDELSTLTWKLKKNLVIQLSFPLNTLPKRYPNNGSVLWKVALLYENDLTAALIPHKTVLKWCMHIENITPTTSQHMTCLFACLFVIGATAPSGSWPPHSRGF